MKKIKKVEDDFFVKKSLNSFKKQSKAKLQEAQKYAKKNPQKTKTILAGLGTVFAAIIAFLIGKKKKSKNKDQDED